MNNFYKWIVHLQTMRTHKTYDYLVVLKKTATYHIIDWVSQLLLLLAVASFGYFVYKQFLFDNISSILGAKRESLLLFIALVIIAWWLYCKRKKAQNDIPYYRFALMFSAWGWYIQTDHFQIATFYLVAAILEKPVKLLPEVAFDHEEIAFNSFPKKVYLWKDVANVVLKDGLLTIDLKNNKLIQKEVDADISDSDEQDFNDFCKDRLKA